jgi:Phage-related minor tail protein
VDTLQIGSLVYAVGLKPGDLDVLKALLAKFGTDNPITVPVNDAPLRALPPAANPATDAIKKLANETSGLRNQFQATGENGKIIADRLTVLRDSALQSASGFTASSDEYKKLTLVAAQAERTITGINGGVTRLGIGYQVTTALQQTFGSSLIALVPGGQSVLDLFQQMGGSLPAVGSGLTTASLGAAAGTLALAGLAAGATALLGSIVALTVKGIPEIYELEKAFSVLEANGSANVQQFANDIAQIQSNTEALGDTFKKSEIATGIAELVKAGADSQFAANLIKSSTVIIAAEGGKLNEFGAGLKSNLANFELGSESVEKTANALAKAALLANTGVTELSKGLNVVGGTASEADFTLEQTLGALVELDQKGLDPAEEGATGLRSALNAIAGPTPASLDQVKRLGINIEEFLGQQTRGRLDLLGKAINATGANLEDLTDLGDTRALAVILKLADGYGEFTTQIENSQGALDKVADSIKGDNEQAAKRYAVAIADLSASFAGIALPVITPILTGLTGFLRNVELIIDPTKRAAFEVNDLAKAYGNLALAEKNRENSKKAFDIRIQIDKDFAELNALKKQNQNSVNSTGVTDPFLDKEIKATEDRIIKLQKQAIELQKIIQGVGKPLDGIPDKPKPVDDGGKGKKGATEDDASKVYTTSKIALDEYRKSIENFTVAQLEAEKAEQKALAAKAASAATLASANKNKLEEAKQRELLSVAEQKYGIVTSALTKAINERETAEKKANEEVKRSNAAYKDLNKDLQNEVDSRKVSSDEIIRYRDRLEKLNEQYGKLSPVLRATAENLLKQVDALAGVADKEQFLASLKRDEREKAFADKLKDSNLEQITAIKLSADKAVAVAFETLQQAKGTKAVKEAKDNLTEAQKRQNQVNERNIELLDQESDAIIEAGKQASEVFKRSKESVYLPSSVAITEAFKAINASLADGVGTLDDYKDGVSAIDKLLADNTIKLSDAQRQFLQTTKDNFLESIKFLQEAADNVVATLTPQEVKPFGQIQDISIKISTADTNLKNGKITLEQYYQILQDIATESANLATTKPFTSNIEAAQMLAEQTDKLNTKIEETASKLNDVSEASANAANSESDRAQAESQADIDQQLKDLEASRAKLQAREDENKKRIEDTNKKEAEVEPTIKSEGAVKVEAAREQLRKLNQDLEDGQITIQDYQVDLSILTDDLNELGNDVDVRGDIEAFKLLGETSATVTKKLLAQNDAINELNQNAVNTDSKVLSQDPIDEEINNTGIRQLDNLAQAKRDLDIAYGKDNDLKKYNEGLADIAAKTVELSKTQGLSLDTFEEIKDLLKEVNTAYTESSTKLDEYAQANKAAEEGSTGFIKILATQKDALVSSRAAIKNLGADLAEGLISPDVAIEGVELQIDALTRAKVALEANGQSTELVDAEIANLTIRLEEFKTLMEEGASATNSFSASLGNAIPPKLSEMIDKYVSRIKAKAQAEKDDKKEQKEQEAAIKAGIDQWTNYANAVTKVIGALKNLKDGKGDVIASITDIASAAGGIIGTIAGGPAVGALVSSVIGTVGSLVGGLVDFIGGLIDPIGKQVEADAKRLGDSLSSSIASAVENAAVKENYSTFSEDFSKAVGKDLFKEIVSSFLRSIALEEILKAPIAAFARAMRTADKSDDAPALANLKEALGVAKSAITSGLPQLNQIANDLGIIEPDEKGTIQKSKDAPKLVSANPSASIQVAVGTDFRIGAEKLDMAGTKMLIAADKQINAAIITEKAMNVLVDALQSSNSNSALRFGN